MGKLCVTGQIRLATTAKAAFIQNDLQPAELRHCISRCGAEICSTTGVEAIEAYDAGKISNFDNVQLIKLYKAVSIVRSFNDSSEKSMSVCKWRGKS